MSNHERLLKYLKKNKSITSLEMLTKLGIYRASDAVYKLRYNYYDKEYGIPYIKTTMVTVKNRYGEKCRVASYSLMRNNHG